MAQSKLQVTRETHKIEFRYDGEYYTFERRSDKTQSYDFIWNSANEKIYGPFHGDCTEEGEKIYKSLKRRIDKN